MELVLAFRKKILSVKTNIRNERGMNLINCIVAPVKKGPSVIATETYGTVLRADNSDHGTREKAS